MSASGVIMLPSTALRQSSDEKSLKSPGGGPPALLTRMSGLGQAASRAWRPASVVTSHTTGVTLTPRVPSSLAVAFSASAPRAQMVTSTPSRASACAQPLPSPFDAAQTMAFFPLMPRSMAVFLTRSPNRLQDARLAGGRQAARPGEVGGRGYPPSPRQIGLRPPLSLAQLGVDALEHIGPLGLLGV